MKLTFRDFTFRAAHFIPSKFGAAALPHWHTYRVRFFFAGDLDQDNLSEQMARRYAKLHGSSLNALLLDSSDEGLAEWLLNDAQSLGDCRRVSVENDFQRGSEVSK